MHMALIFDGCEDTGHETLVFLFEYCSDLLQLNKYETAPNFILLS